MFIAKEGVFKGSIGRFLESRRSPIEAFISANSHRIKHPSRNYSYLRVNRLAVQGEPIELLRRLREYARVEEDCDIKGLYRVWDKQSEFDDLINSKKLRRAFLFQDKASCVPVECLIQGEDPALLSNALAIDCTAAPGNKTL